MERSTTYPATAVAHGLSLGKECNELIVDHGIEAWNAGVMVAAGEGAVDDWPVDDSHLLDALAHPLTVDLIRINGLVRRSWARTTDGQSLHTAAKDGVDGLMARGSTFQTSAMEDACLALGKECSLAAHDGGEHGMTWAHIDVVDHVIAAIEPLIGEAVTLRQWACGRDCALPNTALAFKRGQLRLIAAKARGNRPPDREDPILM